MFLRTIGIFLGLVLTLASCGQASNIVKGSGKVIKQERKLESFDKIVLSGMGTLILKQADKTNVIVETDDNIQEYVRTNVSADTLYIDVFKNVSLSATKDITYYVDFKGLKSVEVAGAATVKSPDTINVKEIKVALSGAGAVDLKINADKVILSLSGSGNIILAGKTKDEVITVSGAGTFKGFELITERAEVNVSGVGNAEVNASKELFANISGVGSVLYKGTPSLKQSITGVGAVRHAE